MVYIKKILHFKGYTMHHVFVNLPDTDLVYFPYYRPVWYLQQPYFLH